MYLLTTGIPSLIIVYQQQWRRLDFFFGGRGEGGKGRLGEGAPFKTVSIINSDSYTRFVLELLPSSCTVLRYNVFLAKHTYGVAEPKLAVQASRLRSRKWCGFFSQFCIISNHIGSYQLIAWLLFYSFLVANSNFSKTQIIRLLYFLPVGNLKKINFNNNSGPKPEPK